MCPSCNDNRRQNTFILHSQHTQNPNHLHQKQEIKKNMVMEKRVLLGVRRKKPIKRTKKSFLKKVVDYLKSDSYIPLIQTPPSHLFPLLKLTTSTGGESVRPVNETVKKLVKDVLEYAKSDCYMYASLMGPPRSYDGVIGAHSSSACSGPLTSMLRSRATEKTNQLDEQPVNVTAENQSSQDQDQSFARDISCGQPTKKRKTVKHVVFKTCHSISVSGERLMDVQASKSTVE